MNVTQEVQSTLNEQIANPQHCHIRLGKGVLFTHGKNIREPFPFDGQPVRFTRMAAERLLQQMPGAKIEEI